MSSADVVTFTVYSRDRCHLCEEMIAGLRNLQACFRFELAVIDIDADPVLARRYGDRVPVLAHGAVELCQYFLEPSAVTAYLSGIR